MLLQPSTTTSDDKDPARTKMLSGGPCSCITNSVAKQLEHIRLMLAEVTSEINAIGNRGCEDVTTTNRNQTLNS